MTTASEPGRFTVRFYYDDLGRLIAKRDHKGNAVQFVYSNPNADWLSVTHIHYPQASRTYQLLYSDEKGRHLVALDTVEERFYIGADQIGSPVAIFDKSGRLVKEIARSPFGRIVKDSNPSLDVPLGFGGGLLDQYTHLVHFGDRVFDPVVGQWMTPAWEKLAALADMRSPFDLFSYRLKHNSPVAAASSAEPSLMNGKK
jgi:YD repeat-containing protein